MRHDKIHYGEIYCLLQMQFLYFQKWQIYSFISFRLVSFSLSSHVALRFISFRFVSFHYFSPFVSIFALLGIIYVSLTTIRQID